MLHALFRLTVAAALLSAALFASGCRGGTGTGFDRTPARIALAADPALLDGEWCGDFFMVSTTINGKGPFRLLLDTGATSTVLDDRVARQLPDATRPTTRTTVGGGGSRVAAQAQLRIESLVSGDASFHEFDAMVIDLENFTAFLGPLDGVLGYSAFNGATFTLDYPNRRVEVSAKRLDAEAPRDDDEAWFRYGNAVRPGVLLRLGDGEVGALVDSGSSGGFDFAQFDALPLASEPIAHAASLHLDRLIVDRIARLEHDIELGPIVFERPVVESAGKGAKLGTDVMATHRWTFDTAARRIRVDNGPTLVQAEPVESLGFVPTLIEEGLLVLLVLEQSPAEAAGLRVDDVILQINGVPASDFSCDGVSEAVDLATPAVLTVRRDDETLSLEVAPFLAAP